MDIASACELWLQYERRDVDSYIDPDDHMKSDVDKYLAIGRSAVRSILAALLTSSRTNVSSILDFGCGHGRVARHLRSLFPEAQLAVADTIRGWVDFCADRYQASPIVTERDLRHVRVPGSYDLIWVGSVFTHVDYDRMCFLFTTLLDALNPGGVLVATFRGPSTMNLGRGVSSEKWEQIVSAFTRDGVGYEDYGLPEWPDWGQALISAGKIAELGYRVPARLIFFSERAWADRQDVAAWQRA